ncbi:hypothetical protein GCM10011316_29170 [Roseibium aquae]|uniref:Antitoxin Xre/MbcA/ParS-like toxin-binding domain-containing protein n=1 Tax=Roseibium aquae TaxID=1323746 RepID=A0A916TM90_9HYPH|nr:hypothetical protein [Roseibium aquae]GGB55266.1 hypothetical protein GCM10011316_29170 [Roseibium aquae]
MVYRKDENGNPDPRHHRHNDQVIALRLDKLMSAQEQIYWHITPHPELGGRTPMELSAEGRHEDLFALIDRMEAARR